MFLGKINTIQWCLLSTYNPHKSEFRLLTCKYLMNYARSSLHINLNALIPKKKNLLVYYNMIYDFEYLNFNIKLCSI